MKEQGKKRIEEAARHYAVNHSAAPDKETPDWIMTDFKAGAEYQMNHTNNQAVNLLNWLIENDYIKTVLHNPLESGKYFRNWKTAEDVFNEFQNKENAVDPISYNQAIEDVLLDLGAKEILSPEIIEILQNRKK